MSEAPSPFRISLAAIVNPISGRRDMRPVVRRIQGILARRGSVLRIACTEAVGHASQLAAEAARDSEAVLVVGGDGTVSEVVNGLRSSRLPMLIMGTGTENLLAREFGMPVEPEEVARELQSGCVLPCDRGLVNDRCFLAVTSVGFDAECVRMLSKSRTGHIGYADYVWPIWRTFWTYPFPPIKVDIDGLEVFNGQGLAFLGLIPRYAANLRILRQAQWDDGLLDICILKADSKLQLVRHAWNMLFQRMPDPSGSMYVQGSSARVASPCQVPVQVDGDFFGTLPIECRVQRHAISLLGARVTRRPES